MKERYSIADVKMRINNDAELPDGRIARFVKKHSYINGAVFLHYLDADNKRIIIVKQERTL